MVDRVGEHFGNYLLLQLLGKGGFAEVYLGQHIYLNSLVAVKLLRTQLVSQEQEQFLHEARIIASLDHPSIVHVLDYAVERDTAFLVMQYAPHGTLRQRYPKGTRVPLNQIIVYSKQLASALHYAHQKKIVHRDIKPENMLFGPHEEVLLSDFGIALISSSSSSQSTKEAAGTAIYMAPEQILGKPRLASDQYSLAVVIYEWLCGTPPFRGSFPELCAQHLYAPVPSLHSKDSSVSEALEQVVMTALAKEPSLRFESIQAFVDALEKVSRLETLQVTSSTLHNFPVEVEVNVDSTEKRPLPQKQESTTALPVSFLTTQNLAGEPTHEEMIHDGAMLSEEERQIRASLLAPRSVVPESSVISYTQVSAAIKSQPEDIQALQNDFVEAKPLLQPVLPVAAPPTYKKRKPGVLILSLSIVLLVLFGSLAFLWQQSKALQVQKSAPPPITATSTLASTQLSQIGTGQASPTSSSKHVATPTATTGATPNATATTGTTPTAAVVATSVSTPTPTPVPSVLTVSPSNLFNNLSSCQTETHGGTGHLDSCTFTLSNSTQTKKTLSWSVSTNSSTVSFDHSSGTIAPGQSVNLFMSATGQICPFSIMLTFQGTDNTVQVPLGCTQIEVTLGTTTLDSSNCTNNGNWVCVVPIIANSGNQTTTSWVVSESSLTGVSFSPAQGTLAPGVSITVTITIASNSCPESGAIWFYVPGGLSEGTNILSWSC